MADKQEIISNLDLPSLIVELIPSAKQTGREYSGLCPYHEEKTSSLSVNPVSGAFKCFACKAKGSIFDLYGKVHGLDFRGSIQELTRRAGLSPGKTGYSATTTKPKEVARFDYHDPAGKLLYQRIRLEPGDNEKKKKFVPIDPATGQWRRPCEPVLYRLPDVVKADIVLICEGELKADVVKGWGLTGTCFDGGANSTITAAMIAILTGKHLVILPDNDEAGRIYRDSIIAAIQGKAASIKVVALPGLPDKGDIVDWIKTPGNGKERLLKLIEVTPEWTAPAIKGTVETAKSTLEIVDTSAEWPEPLPLPDGLPPVKPLEPAMIPTALRGWLMDIADRMQIPPDFSTAAAIVALGSIIGRGCGIYPKKHDDWLVVANLWGAAVGRPSLMKTPAVSEAQRHLVRLESEAREEYQQAMKAFGIHSEIIKLTKSTLNEEIKKAIKNSDDDALEQGRRKLAALQSDEPTRRRYQTQDGTVEKIGELLNENPRGMLVNRDELIGWFRTLDKDGREGDRAFYLEAWNGNRNFTYDRIGRGTLDIAALCISVFGAITPGPLSNYVYQANRGGNGDDGLLQRFQVFVWPDAPTEWVNIDRFPDTSEKNRAWKIFKALSGNIPGAIMEDGADIPSLRFSPGGQQVFDGWRLDIEQRLRSEHGLHPALESHLTKYRSLMPSLALIFHLVDLVDGASSGLVSEQAAIMATLWCEYLESHAGRIYGGATMPGMDAAREIVKHIRRGAIQDGVTIRELWRPQWSRLTNSEEVKAGLTVLQDYDWLIMDKINTKGRPSEVVRLNPRTKL